MSDELKARIAQLEEALKADKASSDFDCPHDAEHRCRCGDLDRELWETAIRLRDAALSTPASDWLAKHDAEVRAQALEEAARMAERFGPSRTPPPHRAKPPYIHRWEGEFAASGSIAHEIRALITKETA